MRHISLLLRLLPSSYSLVVWREAGRRRRRWRRWRRWQHAPPVRHKRRVTLFTFTRLALCCQALAAIVVLKSSSKPQKLLQRCGDFWQRQELLLLLLLFLLLLFFFLLGFLSRQESLCSPDSIVANTVWRGSYNIINLIDTALELELRNRLAAVSGVSGASGASGASGNSG